MALEKPEGKSAKHLGLKENYQHNVSQTAYRMHTVIRDEAERI